MERWQGERLKTARRKLEEFIERGEAEMLRIQRQVEEARKLRKSLASLEDFR